MNVTVLGKLSQLLALTSYLCLSCCETAPDMSTQCWLALQYVQVSCLLTAIQGKLQDAVIEFSTLDATKVYNSIGNKYRLIASHNSSNVTLHVNIPGILNGQRSNYQPQTAAKRPASSLCLLSVCALCGF